MLIEPKLIFIFTIILITPLLSNVYGQEVEDIEIIPDNTPTGLISEIFDYLRIFFQNWVSEGDVEKYENPLGTTNDELEALTNNAVNSGQAGAELFFTLEETTISLIQVLSPIDLSLTIISIIALGVTLLIVIRLFHGMADHMLVVLTIVIFIIIILMAFGTDISI